MSQQVESPKKPQGLRVRAKKKFFDGAARRPAGYEYEIPHIRFFSRTGWHEAVNFDPEVEMAKAKNRVEAPRPLAPVAPALVPVVPELPVIPAGPVQAPKQEQSLADAPLTLQPLEPLALEAHGQLPAEALASPGPSDQEVAKQPVAQGKKQQNKKPSA